MGAKTWMLVYSSAPVGEELKANELDREKTEAFLKELYPRKKFVAEEDTDLSDTCPRGSAIHIGCYGEVAIVAAGEFGIDYPSKLKEHYLMIS